MANIASQATINTTATGMTFQAGKSLTNLIDGTYENVVMPNYVFKTTEEIKLSFSSPKLINKLIFCGDTVGSLLSHYVFLKLFDGTLRSYDMSSVSGEILSPGIGVTSYARIYTVPSTTAMPVVSKMFFLYNAVWVTEITIIPTSNTALHLTDIEVHDSIGINASSPNIISQGDNASPFVLRMNAGEEAIPKAVTVTVDGDMRIMNGEYYYAPLLNLISPMTITAVGDSADKWAFKPYYKDALNMSKGVGANADITKANADANEGAVWGEYGEPITLTWTETTKKAVYFYAKAKSDDTESGVIDKSVKIKLDYTVR